MLVSQHNSSSEAWQSLVDFLVDLNGYNPDDVKAQEFLLKQSGKKSGGRTKLWGKRL